MKYFIAHRTLVSADMDYQISKEHAFNMYKEKAGSGKLNLVAIPNFNKGVEVFVRRGTIKLWGEHVSESECFRRRLIGSLHTEVPTE